MDARDRWLLPSEIVRIVTMLGNIADDCGVGYALIGGALFRLLGAPWETTDIDVAATGPLKGSAIAGLQRTMPIGPSMPTSSHYKIGDTNIDWMAEGRKGSRALFQSAVKWSALNSDAIWLADINHALAIKWFAGRPKDRNGVMGLLRAGFGNREIVNGLLRAFTRKESNGKA